MTDRYVGIGGNDGSDGLSWANRKLTLNGAEDTPVVAGDTVYVGPGVYRELLVIDVSGTSGSPITYIGDVTGENTDSVGGLVRITGSDNDTTKARAHAIDNNSTQRNYRTFRGFFMDMTSDSIVQFDGGGTNVIIEDCQFSGNAGTNGSIAIGPTDNQADWTIRRCTFWDSNGITIRIWTSADVNNVGHLVENCLFVTSNGDCINILNCAPTIKNCTFLSGGDDHVDVQASHASESTVVENCILVGADGSALEGVVTGDIAEDFNTFWQNATDRSNTPTGGNSIAYPPIFNPRVMLDGIRFPQQAFEPSEWSQTARIAGNSEATDDFFGVVRPTVSAKKSWGAIQLREAERETGTVQTGSAALTLADAGDHQIFVPTTATSTTFKVAARYESEYAGTLPQLIVRQPGQADSTDTMVAAADTWEDLSITLTPDANPPYVVVILRSLNTSVTGDFDTYWDDLDVS